MLYERVFEKLNPLNIIILYNFILYKILIHQLSIGTPILKVFKGNGL